MGKSSISMGDFPWLCLTMVISTRSPGSLWANVLGLAWDPILMYEMFESHHPDMVPPLAAWSQKNVESLIHHGFVARCFIEGLLQ
jgi:hypothetical protein